MRSTAIARALSGGLIYLIATAVALPMAVVFTMSEAQAQEVRRGRTLFDMLFNRDRERAEPPAQRTDPRPRVRRQSGGAQAGSAGAQQRRDVPEAVAKNEDARVLLVVGDFMGGGLAEGLEEAFATSATIRIEGRSNGSSGFVRDDFYDWPGQIGQIIDETNPAAVAVMLGSNDRQQMLVGGTREDVRSDPWTKEYTARVTALATAIRGRGLPLVWVGLPAFKSSTMSADMLAFNDIYRSVAEQVGGEFIDIWDGFVDENGAFATIGPDMNGQRVRLRGSDGINLTAAGKRKVAFYAERSLNRIFENEQAPGLAALPPSGEYPAGQGPQAPLAPFQIERTQPIALSDPALDGGSELMGARPHANPVETPRSPVEKLAIEGTTTPAKPGRADDFLMRKLEVAPGPATSETTTAISR